MPKILFIDKYPEVIKYIVIPDVDELSKITHGSHKEIVLVCDHGHETTSTFIAIHKQLRKGMNFCKRCRKPTLFDRRPYWLDFYNGDDPYSIPFQGSSPVKWKDDKGEWEESPIEMKSRHHVPGVSPRKKTLLSEYPDVVQWTDDEVENITTASHMILNFSCPDKGHTFSCPVYHWTRMNGKCPICSGRSLGEQGENSVAVKLPHLAETMTDDPHTIHSGALDTIITYSMNGKVLRSTLGTAISRIENGYKTISSISERSLSDFIHSIVEDDVMINTRSVISPEELDIYIPEKKIAIEYNGLYCHSEGIGRNGGKDKDYHHEKWRLCKNQGIQLITIWEDEWRDKEDIVKSMLSHKLGNNTSRRVYARKSSVVVITKHDAESFLDKNHIQGYVPGSEYLGLAYNNEIVAVSVWRKVGRILYLDRYATSCNVIGGMGKLLKQGIRYARDHGCTEIVTFSDHCVSDGGLYEKLGFRLDKELKPDYRYVVGNKRVHKFNYRIKRFRDDESLIYDEGMTEKQLAEVNGIRRIWDCGKSRYVIDVI